MFVPVPLKARLPDIEAEPAISKRAVGLVVPIPTLPFPFITNLLHPDELAVNKSPTPSLFATKAAKDVLPEIEATARVPASF